MKVSTMIKMLQEMPQDLEVVSYCDHAQTPEFSMSPCVRYVKADEFEEGEMESSMDLEEALEAGYTEEELVKIVML